MYMTILGIETTLEGEVESRWGLLQDHYGEEVWEVMGDFVKEKIMEEYDRIVEEYENDIDDTIPSHFERNKGV